MPVISYWSRLIPYLRGQQREADCGGSRRHLTAYRRQLLACVILTLALAPRAEAVYAEVAFQGSTDTAFQESAAPFTIFKVGEEHCCGHASGKVALGTAKLEASIESKPPPASQFGVRALGQDNFIVQAVRFIGGVPVALPEGTPLPEEVGISITVRLKGILPSMPEGIIGHVTAAANLTVGRSQDVKRFSSTGAGLGSYIQVAAGEEFEFSLTAGHVFTTVGRVTTVRYLLQLLAASGAWIKTLDVTVTPTLPPGTSLRSEGGYFEERPVDSIVPPTVELDIVHPATGRLEESKQHDGDGGYVAISGPR